MSTSHENPKTNSHYTKHEILYQLAHDLARAPDVGTIANHLFARARTYLGADYALLMLADSEGVTLQGIDGYGLDLETVRQERINIQTERAPVTLAFQQKQPIIVHNMPRQTQLSERLRKKYPLVHDAWAVPLMSGEKAIGALVLGYATSHQATVEDLHLLQLLGDEAALALERARLTEELRCREAQYREVVDNAHDIITSVSLQGIFTKVNPALETVLGWTPAEVLGQHYSKFLTPASTAIMAERERCFATGKRIPSIYEIEVLHKDGSVFPLESHSRLIRDPTGKPVSVLIIHRDIRERKQAAKELQTTNAMLQALLQASPLAIIALDEGGIVQFWNPAAERTLGWSAQEALGQPYPLVTPDQWNDFMAAHRRVLQGGTFTGLEVRRQKKDGTPIDLSIATALLRDTKGAPIAAMGVLADITTRKQAERIIQEEGKVARALARVGQELISSLNTPILLDRLCSLTAEVLDADYSHTTLWQPQDNAYVTVAGYGETPEQTEARRAFKTPAERYMRLLTRLEQESVVERCTEDVRDPIEQIVLRRLHIATVLYLPLRRNEKIIGVQTVWYRTGKTVQPHHRYIARGISQIASLALANAMLFEELKQANQLKEDFIGSVSHELRTPLHIIMGYAELLQDQALGPLNDEQQHTLSRINHSANELLDLINTVLDLSRLQSRHILPARQHVDIALLFAELEADMQQLISHSAVRIEWRMAHDLPPLVTDLIKLRMVLKNLLTNAIKFTERGTISVAADQQGNNLVFSVHDTGIGIAPEALPFIFEPFRQAETSSTNGKKGVGLGLYIVRQLVSLLGGETSVTSALGQGSVFHVTIPSTTEGSQ
jgi:PAS domain S-box-containing protein